MPDSSRTGSGRIAGLPTSRILPPLFASGLASGRNGSATRFPSSVGVSTGGAPVVSSGAAAAPAGAWAAIAAVTKGEGVGPASVSAPGSEPGEGALAGRKRAASEMDAASRPGVGGDVAEGAAGPGAASGSAAAA